MRPALPGPDPQINPTFPRRRQQLPPSVPGTRTTTTPSVCKSLKITVPRAPQRTPLLLDVIDIFDDADAWSIFVPTDPSTSTSTSNSNIGNDLSQLRIPEALTSAYSAYDPVEIIRACVRDCAILLHLFFISNLLSPSFLSEYDTDDDNDDDDDEWWTMDDIRKKPDDKLLIVIGFIKLSEVA